ncbi:MAG: DUF4159 domain-containing protein [Flavobacteriales bacterium]|jgi:hypothetical protein|nr:DUF4159 domain-containing protein [Flavobacteriales bacterium]MCB0758257.1 DUF4159 domain-containing protein [Flavobacteriales bacterium]
MRAFLLSLAVLLGISASSQGTFQLAVLKYSGGGDWYANPTAVPNLVKFCNEQLGMNINPEVPTVDVGSPDIFSYPWLDATGHGNITFSPQEAENLRNYLIGGGFLHVSDNYGMDKFLRPALKLVFPELDLVELPFSHPIYHQQYNFPRGLPKIHEHDGLPAQGFGLIWEGRLVCFYDYETDLGDGWEDPDVHNDPPELRTKALQMGANMVQYVFGGAE